MSKVIIYTFMIVFILLNIKVTQASLIKDTYIIPGLFNSTKTGEVLHLPARATQNFSQMCVADGYPVSEHNVVTSDGYILTIFNIPHGKNQTSDNKIPVLLQHGFIDSADSWVVMGNGSALAYQLADAGYNVWASNVRGNKYGRAHVTLNPDKDVQFWRFSFDEMAKYDVPAVIDFILENTGQKQLAYIGHSQGGGIFLALTSIKPAYNDKISISILLAPYAFAKYAESQLFKVLAFNDQLISSGFNLLGQQEFLSDKQALKQLAAFLGSNPLTARYVASDGIIFPFTGYDNNQLDQDKLSVLFEHVPQGTSRQATIHILQLRKFGKFQQYDYGSRIENLKVYGEPSPPEYDLKNITTKVAFIIGANDWLVSVKDTMNLKSSLKNAQVVDYHVVEYKKWNHLDFTLAIEQYKYITPRVLRMLEKYS